METVVQNPSVWYISHKIGTGAVTWWKVTGDHVVKHAKISSECSTMHWLGIVFL